MRSSPGRKYAHVVRPLPVLTHRRVRCPSIRHLEDLVTLRRPSRVDWKISCRLVVAEIRLGVLASVGQLSSRSVHDAFPWPCKSSASAGAGGCSRPSCRVRFSALVLRLLGLLPSRDLLSPGPSSPAPLTGALLSAERHDNEGCHEHSALHGGASLTGIKRSHGTEADGTSTRVDPQGRLPGIHASRHCTPGTRTTRTRSTSSIGSAADDWVNVVAITEGEEVVMIRQYRHGSATVTLEIPGGMVDPKANRRRTAAARELVEETGYTPASTCASSVRSTRTRRCSPTASTRSSPVGAGARARSTTIPTRRRWST